MIKSPPVPWEGAQEKPQPHSVSAGRCTARWQGCLPSLPWGAQGPAEGSGAAGELPWDRAWQRQLFPFLCIGQRRNNTGPIRLKQTGIALWQDTFRKFQMLHLLLSIRTEVSFPFLKVFMPECLPCLKNKEVFHEHALNFGAVTWAGHLTILPLAISDISLEETVLAQRS